MEGAAICKTERFHPKETEHFLEGLLKLLHQTKFTRKTSTLTLLTMSKPLTVWITTNCGKFFKRWEYQTTLPASWEICVQVKKKQLELDRKQQTGSRLRTEYIKTVYCHPVYLTYTQRTSCEMPGWNQDCQEKYH